MERHKIKSCTAGGDLLTRVHDALRDGPGKRRVDSRSPKREPGLEVIGPCRADQGMQRYVTRPSENCGRLRLFFRRKEFRTRQGHLGAGMSKQLGGQRARPLQRHPCTIVSFGILKRHLVRRHRSLCLSSARTKVDHFTDGAHQGRP